jgi:hypothetical protein
MVARTKTPDGKRITIATKVSEPTAAAIDTRRGPVTRSEWLASAAMDALGDYRHERRDNCHHRREHQLTCDEYDALRARAQGCCEICGTPETDTKRGLLIIDHYEDKTTWYIRGLVCDPCNQVMSCYDEHKPWGANRVWEQKAAEYASRAFQHPSKAPRGRKRLITYRVDEDEYNLAASFAESLGETVSDVLTRAVRAYVRGESIERLLAAGRALLSLLGPLRCRRRYIRPLRSRRAMRSRARRRPASIRPTV